MWNNKNAHTFLVETQTDRNHQDIHEEKQSQRIFFTECEVLTMWSKKRERERQCHIGREVLRQNNGTEYRLNIYAQYILKMFAMQSIKKKKQTTSFKCIVPGQSNINSGGKKKKKCNGRRVDYYLKSQAEFQ